MIKRAKRAVCSALLAIIAGTAQADMTPLTLKAPLPTIRQELPKLPPHEVWVEAPKADVVAQKQSNLRPIDAQAQVSAFGFPCKTDISLEHVQGAMLQLQIDAPCKPGMGVTVTHVGLPLDLQLSQTGSLFVSVPALEEHARIDIRFEDGSFGTRSVKVTDLSGFLRVALRARHVDGLHLTGNAPARTRLQRFQLGSEDGNMLQVISHPIDPEQRKGVIRLALQTYVSAADCNQARFGHVVDYAPNRPLLTYMLELAPPGCDHAGEILELKNILQDLKLATH